MNIRNLALTAALSLTLLGCGERTMSAGGSSGNPKTPPYAMRGADQSWPGAPGNDIQLASNLQAKNYYFVFDGSGSMEETSCGDGRQRIETAKNAFIEFIGEVSPNDNIGLFLFDYRGARQALALGNNQSMQMKQLIERAVPGNKTPLGAAITVGYQQLQLQAQKQQGYGEYHLLILTDGIASDERAMVHQVDRISALSPINIHTIGFCIGEGHTLNRKGIVNYQSAQNAKELISGLRGVLAESESFDVNSFEGS